MSASPARRYPPFGREVAQALATGHTPNVYIFACGRDPWAKANARRSACGETAALVLPPGEDPESFRWPALPDVMVDITGLDSVSTQRLARALVRDGVRLAYLLDSEHHERDVRLVAKAGPT